jgi:hypothetical protein
MNKTSENLSLIESKSGRYVLCALVLCFPFLSLVFESLNFSFAHQLQTAENTIFLDIENIFHSSLGGTMSLYTTITLLHTVELG